MWNSIAPVHVSVARLPRAGRAADRAAAGSPSRRPGTGHGAAPGRHIGNSSCDCRSGKGYSVNLGLDIGGGNWAGAGLWVQDLVRSPRPHLGEPARSGKGREQATICGLTRMRAERHWSQTRTRLTRKTRWALRRPDGIVGRDGECACDDLQAAVGFSASGCGGLRGLQPRGAAAVRRNLRPGSEAPPARASDFRLTDRLLRDLISQPGFPGRSGCFSRHLRIFFRREHTIQRGDRPAAGAPSGAGLRPRTSSNVCDSAAVGVSGCPRGLSIRPCGSWHGAGCCGAGL